MPDGFEVDVSALRLAADGIARTTDAARARPLDAGPGPEIGHARLTDARADFLHRWETGVEHLTADAHGIASALLGAAVAYERADGAGAHAFSGMLRSDSGRDPAAR